MTDRLTNLPKHKTFVDGLCRFTTTLSLLAVVLPISFSSAYAGPKTAKSPEILFIGDSHLSFGAGRVYRDFFRDFEKHCKPEESWMGQARAVAKRSFSLMGVKSTAPHNWVSKRRSLKKMVCEPDPKWPVNARLYGFDHRRDGSYVQLGRDKSFPFCRKNKTPFEAVFEWSKPQLLVLYFTGNTIQRWARTPRPARRDVIQLMEHLPKDTGCVFMTTSPVYRKSHNEERVKAQRNIAAAFKEHGNMRCEFVPMLTPKTIAAIEGKANYFLRRKNGRVKDPYHPLIAASRKLLEIQRRPLCRAVLSALRPKQHATIKQPAEAAKPR